MQVMDEKPVIIQEKRGSVKALYALCAGLCVCVVMLFFRSTRPSIKDEFLVANRARHPRARRTPYSQSTLPLPQRYPLAAPTPYTRRLPMRSYILPIACSGVGVTLFLGALLVSGLYLGWFGGLRFRVAPRLRTSQQALALAVHQTPVPISALDSPLLSTPTPRPTPQPSPSANPSVIVGGPVPFQSGIAYPRLNSTGYGSADDLWQHSLPDIKKQVGVSWIEIPVQFSQASSTSTKVDVDANTVNVQSFVEGVKAAHQQGLQVFFVPLIQVREPNGWSGNIYFQNVQQTTEWFNSYWTVLRPYVQAAAANHVEQMAIATECEGLQNETSNLWTNLIANIRAAYPYRLTYDMNWTSLDKPVPDWFSSPDLATLGVTTFIPLSDLPQKVDPLQMPLLWQQKVKSRLDALAVKVKKHVLISELGFRSSTDNLYQPWVTQTDAPFDAQQQSAAYEAALASLRGDSQIAGVFIWSWDGTDRLSVKNQPALQVIHKWFTTPTLQGD